MSTVAAAELERYPKYKQAYLRAFDKMLEALDKTERKTTWKTAEDVVKWWLGGKA